MKQLIRVDRNGTKYYESNECPRCGGSGKLPYYVYDGVCFKCNGSGYYKHTWKEYTEEYTQILNERRLRKAIEKSDKVNKQYFLNYGADENGIVWIPTTSNTYEIKNELKSMGGRFNNILNWFFNYKPETIETIQIDLKEFSTQYEDHTYSINPDKLLNHVTNIKNQYLPKSSSVFVGNVGDKNTFTLNYQKSVDFDSMYGTQYMHIFKDANENEFIWVTSKSPLDFDKELTSNTTYNVCGTIKNHKEYKGTKQTILTRCKIA